MKLPDFGDVLRLPNQSYRAIEQGLALLPRVTALVGQAEALIARAAALVSSIDKTGKNADAVVARTDLVVSKATDLIDRTTVLVDRFEPILDRLQPMIAHLAKTTSPAEVDALVKLIDLMPDIADKLAADILPVLDTLGTVAPDIRDLLDVSRELNIMIGSVPGFRRIKRKVEAEQDAEDTYRADDVPPSSPDRASSHHLADQ